MKETTQRIANQDQFHPFAAAMAAAYELAMTSVSPASPTDEERDRELFAQLQKQACGHAPTAVLQAENGKLRSEVSAVGGQPSYAEHRDCLSPTNDDQRV